MKSSLGKPAGWLGFWFFLFAIPLPAQTNVSPADFSPAALGLIEQTTPLPADQLPPFGMYYSSQYPGYPPLPGNIRNLSAWSLGGDSFLLNDLSYDYSSFATPEAGARSRPGLRAMGDFGDDGATPQGYTVPTNGLWLSLTNLLNGTVNLNLNHATDYVYDTNYVNRLV